MIKFLLFISGLMLVTGCAQDKDSIVQTNTEEQAVSVQQNVEKDINWVDYADPIADANFAIAKGNFELLAFTNKTISLPGLDVQQEEQAKLAQMCGFRYLEGSGDELTAETDMQRRKRLRIYASQYNQFMRQACIKGHNAT